LFFLWFEGGFFMLFGIRESKPSATLEAARLAREAAEIWAKNNPDDSEFCHLTLGEPDSPPPQNFLEKAFNKIAQIKRFAYTAVAGEAKIVQDVVQFMREEFDYPEKLGDDQVPVDLCLASGAKSALTDTMKALVSKETPKRVFIVPTPFWPSYEAQIENAGGTMVKVPCSLEQEYKITDQQLRETLKQYPEAVFILNNPSNPTGAVYDNKELEKLAAVLRDFPKAAVIEDAIYNRITRGELPKLLAVVNPKIADRVLTIFGFAKDLSLPGERVAWVLGNSNALKTIKDIVSELRGNTPITTQCIAHEAVSCDNRQVYRDFCDQQRGLYAERMVKLRDFFTSINALCTEPRGAFYLLPDFSHLFSQTETPDGDSINNAEDLWKYLLKKGVAGTPGSPFDAPNCIRFSYATSPDTIELAGQRIVDAVRDLKVIGQNQTFGQFLDQAAASQAADATMG
jgi:aspartate aminotransferase